MGRVATLPVTEWLGHSDLLWNISSTRLITHCKKQRNDYLASWLKLLVGRDVRFVQLKSSRCESQVLLFLLLPLLANRICKQHSM